MIIADCVGSENPSTGYSGSSKAVRIVGYISHRLSPELMLKSAFLGDHRCRAEKPLNKPISIMDVISILHHVIDGSSMPIEDLIPRGRKLGEIYP